MSRLQLWKTLQFSVVILGTSGIWISSVIETGKGCSLEKKMARHCNSCIFTTSGGSVLHGDWVWLPPCDPAWNCTELLTLLASGRQGTLSRRYRLHAKLSPARYPPLTTFRGRSECPLIKCIRLISGVFQIWLHHCSNCNYQRLQWWNIVFDFLLSAEMPLLLL